MQIEASPTPLTDGATVEVRVMLHNRSATPAAGSIAVELVHDRATPQPLPHSVEVVYLRPDEISEVTFEVPLMAMRSSPYTFFAVVDAGNTVAETDELANTAWRRFEVCGAPGAEEIADGFDNDCDGQFDEDAGRPADTSAALAMLRALQRRAQHDGAPLVWALPRLFAPAAREQAVQLASEEGHRVGRQPPAGMPPTGDAPGSSLAPGELGAVLADGDEAAWLTLVDWNGGLLSSGDLIGLRVRAGEAAGSDGTIIAPAGGGGPLVTGRDFRPREALFTLIKPGGAPGTPIETGDSVLLAASTGHFVTAEQGGGDRLRADRTTASGWETFTLVFAPGP